MNVRGVNVRGLGCLVSLWLAAGTTGCTENAILALQVQAPAAAGTARFAVVQAYVDRDFATPWGYDADFVSLPLGVDPSVATVDLVADQDALDSDVRAKVRFCERPDCSTSDTTYTPEARIEIAHPFYRLERTEYFWQIPVIPPVGNPLAVRVERCDVRGCRGGIATRYCEGELHYCEL